MLECKNGAYYTGITTNIERRFNEHLQDKAKGAKYTRINKPVRIIYKEVCENRSLATSREIDIKKLSRAEKELLVANVNLQ